MSDDEGGITQPQSTVKMMQSVAITPMPEFCPDAKLGTSLATKWNNWQSDFDMYLTASGITDPTRKRALLLYQAGPRVREIFKQIPDTGTSADYDTAKDKLKAHFDPQKNKRYEVYRFRQATQESNETLDQFHTRLRTMAETCEFTDIEFEIEEQIIIGGRSSKIRKRALRDPTFDLKAMLIEGRRDEQSTFQTKEIESKETKGGETNRLAQQHGNNISNYKSTCKNCGREFPHKGACPARGKTCNNCGKPNHFATVCRAKQDPIRIPRKTRKNKQHGHKNIRTLDTEQNSSSDEEYLYTVTDAKPDNKVNVTVGGSKFKIAVDTGATINVIDYGTFEQMKDIKLTRTNMKAYAYSKTSPVEFIGKFEAVIETKKRMSVATFFVVKAKHCGNLLSLNTAQELGLVSLHLNKLTSKDAALDHILQKHSTVFTGSGKLHGTQIKLDIDKTKVPKAQPQRRIPYHLREKVKTAIHELEKQDIIERVPDNEATPWVSPIVAVPKKDGQVRICVDMRLPIVWAVEHFHLFLFGSEFTLVTDHKPLEIIYGKRTTKTSARIERWVLRLQPYSFRIVYQAGSNNPADYLSRHPTAESCRKQEKMTEQYINFVAQHSVPKAMTLAEIIDATNSDAVLTQVKDAIRTNKWDSPAVKPFKPVKEELTTTSQGIVLRGTRIVIPAVLQQRTIDLAHQAHFGIDKTKSLIREKIWFPQIDNRVKSTIDHCLPCQAVGRPNPPEPITTTRMPKHPWTTLHVDFYGPLQTQEYLLVVIDRYSRFPEVDIVHSTKAAAVIPKLDRMFAVHGIPDVLISDNGPPFNSTDYKQYLETLGITPKFSTPLWPQGNAQAERFMQGLGKVLQTAKIQNRPWRQELSRFLLQYRTTPHSSTGVPPSELLFNRKIRGTLPVLSRNIIVNRHNEAREKESRRQEYNKSYVNNRRNTKKSNISVGDYVLVRQPKQNKLTPHFSQKPYLVIHKNKTVIKARSTDGHEIERNISHFKKIPKSNDNESDDSDDLNDYHDHETEQNARNAQIVNDNNEDQDQVRRSTRTKRVPERYGQSP